MSELFDFLLGHRNFQAVRFFVNLSGLTAFYVSMLWNEMFARFENSFLLLKRRSCVFEIKKYGAKSASGLEPTHLAA